MKQKDTTPKSTEDQLLDKLIEEAGGQGGNTDLLLKNLSKRVLERMMNVEMTEHLGYEKNAPEGNNSGNSRNGHSKKTLKTELGNIELKVPRDRNGEFEPVAVPKGASRLEGFDEKIISLYTSGMSTRDIQQHLFEIYNIKIEPDFISKVTDAVLEEVAEWRNRPLDETYPIVYMDALVLKVRKDGMVTNRAFHLVLGIDCEGQKDLLGIWSTDNEGASFWSHVLTELQNRGVKDILIACVDGLSGFPDAIASIFPKTDVQLCIVHMIRNSVKYISYKERKTVCSDLKNVYAAPTEEKAKIELKTFSEKWDSKYPSISKSWESRWENIIPFFNFGPDIRKAIYTTNAIESLNMSLRKTTKTRGSFSTEDSAMKLLYLGIKKASKKWTMPIKEWGLAYSQLSVKYPDRLS